MTDNIATMSSLNAMGLTSSKACPFCLDIEDHKHLFTLCSHARECHDQFRLPDVDPPTCTLYCALPLLQTTQLAWDIAQGQSTSCAPSAGDKFTNTLDQGILDIIDAPPPLSWMVDGVVRI